MSIVFTGIRFAANSVTQIGASIIVKNVIKATTPEEVSKFSKVAIAIGGYGISAAVGVAAAKQIDDLIKVIPPSFKKGNKIGEDLAEAKSAKEFMEQFRKAFPDYKPEESVVFNQFNAQPAEEVDFSKGNFAKSVEEEPKEEKKK